MQCPKCGSDNTQRLEVIFDGGTQSIKTKSNTTGAGFGGAFGVGGAVTSTSGTSQSTLAQKAAPPAKKSLKWPIFGILSGLGSFTYGGFGILLGLILIGVSIHFGLKVKRFNSTEWPGLYQHWSESWMCHKCGNIYHQP